MSKSISSTDLKKLCLRSGNRCAFPGCNDILIVDKTDKDGESIVGEMAHIKGEKPNAPRYDHNMSDEERNGYSNRILLCRKHHKIIDDQWDILPSLS